MVPEEISRHHGYREMFQAVLDRKHYCENDNNGIGNV